MLEGLQNGDKVVTQGGIIGVITSLKSDVVTVRIADDVRVDLQRSSVSRLVSSKKTNKED